MSNEELSRWISEKWEPKPVQWEEEAYYSPLGAWICNNPQSEVEVGKFSWYPRDWTQPEASTMLLGALIDKLGMKQAFEELEIVLSDYAETDHLYSYHLPRAIMNAYALANGYNNERP